MGTSIIQIKNNLHRLVVETNDEQILHKVQAYFSQLNSKHADWWENASESEKKTVQIGLKQLENGERVSDEEVKRKVNRLLNR